MHPCRNLGNSNYYAIRIKEDIMRFAISNPQFVADGEFDPAGLRAYLATSMAQGCISSVESIPTLYALKRSPAR